MKNLQTLNGFQELSNNELQNINGGFVCGGFCVGLIVGIVVGAAIAS